jgi:hypothetical protein
MRQAIASLVDVPLEVTLDKDANYAGLRNREAIVARLHKALRPLLAFGAEAELSQIDDTTKRDAARKDAHATVDATMASVFSPGIVEGLVGRTPQTYNGFVGIDLEPDQAYELETELPNPLGGAPFPAKLTLSLSVSKEDPDDMFVAWDQAIDGRRVGEASAAIAEKLGAKPADAGATPANVDIRDEGLFLVHRPSGVIEMFETTRTTTSEGYARVERTRMRLLDGEHEHVWRDEAGQAEVLDDDD